MKTFFLQIASVMSNALHAPAQEIAGTIDRTTSAIHHHHVAPHIFRGQYHEEKTSSRVMFVEHRQLRGSMDEDGPSSNSKDTSTGDSGAVSTLSNSNDNEIKTLKQRKLGMFRLDQGETEQPAAKRARVRAKKRGIIIKEAMNQVNRKGTKSDDATAGNESVSGTIITKSSKEGKKSSKSNKSSTRKSKDKEDKRERERSKSKKDDRRKRKRRRRHASTTSTQPSLTTSTKATEDTTTPASSTSPGTTPEDSTTATTATAATSTTTSPTELDWSQLGVDIDGESLGDQSGRSVSLSSDGTRVAIGAPYNNGHAPYNNRGHVRVYDFNGTSWNQLGNDIDGENAYDESGLSVSLSADGSTVAIGAPENHGNGTEHPVGHVRVYVFNDDSTVLDWNQLGNDINGEKSGDYSGNSVSLSGDGTRVAIGAPYNDGNDTDTTGHVRVYDFNGTSWNQLGNDIDGNAYDQSGWSVSLSADGSTVAIGAPYDGASGHVRVYVFNDSSTVLDWIQLGNDIDGERADDWSGWSVSLSVLGRTVAIGSRLNDNINGENSGQVRVYDFNGTSWNQLGGDIDGENEYDQSGWSVSLSGDGTRVAIGAFGNDGVIGINRGHVRVHEYNGTSWNQLGGDIDGENAQDFSGSSVSLSEDGKTVAIGAPGNGRTGSSDGHGHVRVYELQATI